MSAESVHPAAHEMRREFDAHFERPRPKESSKTEEFLILRSAGRRVALRVRDLAGLFRCPKVTRFPNDGSAVVGLVSLQGSVVVVHDAATILGMAASPGASGWVVLLRGDRTCALLFENPECYQRVREADMVLIADRSEEPLESSHAFVVDGEPIIIVGHQRWEQAIHGAAPSELLGEIRR